MAGPWEKYQSAPASAPRGGVFQLPADPQTLRTNDRQERNDAFSHDAERQRIALAQRASNNADEAAKMARAAQAMAQQRLQQEAAARRGEAQDAYEQMNGLQGTVDRLRTQYNTNFKGQPASRGFGLAELLSAVMRPANGVFNDTAKSLLADLAKAKGLTSQQFNTPVEQQMFFSPMIPSASDTDAQIASKIDALQRLVNQGKMKYMRPLGKVPVKRGQAPTAANKTVDFNDLP